MIIKYLVLFLIFMQAFTTSAQNGNRLRKVTWDQWYDSAAFFNGPLPLIDGIGELSDSLSQVHGGLLLYEFEGQYYRINCLADYYFWFTRKYEFLFRKDVKEYESNYFDGRSFSLARFVKLNYKGKKLPVKFRFPYSQRFIYSDPPVSQDSAGPPTTVRFKSK